MDNTVNAKDEALHHWQILGYDDRPEGCCDRQKLEFSVVQFLLDKKVRDAYIELLRNKYHRYAICGFDDQMLQRISKSGLSVLSNDELFWLSIYPFALRRIAELICSGISEYWTSQIAHRDKLKSSGRLKKWIESTDQKIPG